jgi:2-polyprenyl-3-methyl-5-hydroxy-6-metoxy-1,4-benzoquinol methylase
MHDVHLHDPSTAGLSLVDRHAHERSTYDAMAAVLLADADDADLVVQADRIPFPNREQVEYLGATVEALGPLAGRRVLEVGAGSGALAVWLALQGADVTGIDVSGGILEVAAKRASLSGTAHRTRFVCVPIEEFDDPDRSYDLVIGSNVVHHFDRERAIANLARLLRPDGRAAFCEPVLFLPDVARRLRYAAVVRRRFPPHTHSPDERSLNRDDLAVISRYFSSVSWQPVQLLCRIQNFVELSDPTFNRLESIDRFVLGHLSAARWLARMIVLTLDQPRPPTNWKTTKEGPR